MIAYQVHSRRWEQVSCDVLSVRGAFPVMHSRSLIESGHFPHRMNIRWIYTILFTALAAGAVVLAQTWDVNAPVLPTASEAHAKTEFALRQGAVQRLEIHPAEDSPPPSADQNPTAATPKQDMLDLIPRDRVVIFGRVVDTDGRPLVAAELWLDWSSKSLSRTDSATLKPDGTFHIVCEDLAIEPEDRLSLAFTLYLPDDDYPIYGLVTDPVPVGSGHIRLGDLRFGLPPVILTGRFRVPSALEHLESIEMDCGWPDEQGYPSQVTGYQIEWRPGLEFSIRGVARAGDRLRLSFFDGMYRRMGPMDFDAGTRDLEIQLQLGCEFEARVLVDDWVQEGDFSCWLIPVAETNVRVSRKHRCTHEDPEDDERVIRSHGLAPGSYRFEITSRDSKHRLMRIDGVVLSLDGKSDPRLGSIDLRGQLRQIRHRVIDAETKQPLEHGATFLTRVLGEAVWTWVFPHETTDRFVVPAQVELMVIEDGYCMTLVSLDGTDIEIPMSRSNGVQVCLRFEQPPPKDANCSLVLTPRLPNDLAGCTVFGDYDECKSGVPLHEFLIAHESLDSEGIATVYPLLDMPHDVAVSLSIRDKEYECKESPKVLDFGVRQAKPIVIDVGAPTPVSSSGPNDK